MRDNKISIASDHAGIDLKNEIIKLLKDKNYHIKDYGTNSQMSVDYPDYAKLVVDSIKSGETQMGILICSTGIGISIAANRCNGIRAALCHDGYTARMSRNHNNANILVMGANCLGLGTAKDIVSIWLESSFEGDRHQRRIEKIDNINS